MFTVVDAGLGDTNNGNWSTMIIDFFCFCPLGLTIKLYRNSVHVYTTQVNRTFRACWLARLEVISQVLFTSEQPKKTKMAFVSILSQIIHLSVSESGGYLPRVWKGGPDPIFLLSFSQESHIPHSFSSLSRIPFLFPRKINLKVKFLQKLLNRL